MQALELTPVLQASIGPVTLISGVGLLLLSMTNRLGRVIDRARILSAEVEKSRAAGKTDESARVQLQIIYLRSEDLRWAVIFSVLSIFFVALLIMALFGVNALKWEINPIVITLFGSSLTCLVVSLVFFLKDIFLALKALKLEVGAQL
ncbi:MAG: hypothetical protein B9S32_02410 [Verrucomicrobia bacterium Tous-C9LFEB]|nr:MAG: hypothetical protein B9S32_02410 [Verrucomicrobia bacterium Tous-C9LFEB]